MPATVAWVRGAKRPCTPIERLAWRLIADRKIRSRDTFTAPERFDACARHAGGKQGTLHRRDRCSRQEHPLNGIDERVEKRRLCPTIGDTPARQIEIGRENVFLAFDF